MKRWLASLMVIVLLFSACQKQEIQPPSEEKAEQSAKEPIVQPVDELKENPIPVEVFMNPMDSDFWAEDGWDIFEEHFYGIWRLRNSESQAIEDSDVVLTYQLAQNSGQYPLHFAETETDWYMSVFNGGSGDLYRISKENLNQMHLYYDYVSRNGLDMDDSDLVYKKASLSDEVMEQYPKELTTGPISVFAVRKLQEDRGYPMTSEVALTTDDGREWQLSDRDTSIYLTEIPNENRISYVRRAFPAEMELGPWDDVVWKNIPWAHINVVMEKVDGQWQQVSANLATLEQELDYIGHLEEFSLNVWANFRICYWDELDYENPTAVSSWEHPVYPLFDARLNTEESLRKYLALAFTEDCVQQILDKACTILMEDGVVYGTDGARGSNMYAGETKHEIIENDGSTATIHYTCYTADYALEYVGREILEEYDIKAVNTDLGWRLADWYWSY